ncbi:iron chelate uptake ABC transporter family permease subunit [Salinisphaera sp. Q1T1-3]|uniref:FecCD family ABC transporter permease n=1 Tax=Salinisphaera sp. Q1T1-3 TaxID=2321229 RepID=UPI000E70E283|nr:iron ABC transporter permease [Salinisphaera sp. Q1T1-3]RJS94399.1 iron ABC transporter permease [Salinisphaera sp. Q1T1-3]
MGDMTIRLAGYSRRIAWRPWRLAGLSLLTCVVIALVSLACGRVWLPPGEWLAGLKRGEGAIWLIVTQLRLPRVVLAAEVGGALALSGWILQQVLRNPLASPDTLGLSGGASAAVVAYLALAAGQGGAWVRPVAAIAGALLVVASVYALALRGGRVTPYRLILIGVGMGALAGAVVTLMLIVGRAELASSAYVWLVGSVYGANRADAVTLGGLLALVLLFGVPLIRYALLAPLDDALAAGIGVSVPASRLALIGVASLLAGLAIAWGGAMAFVGLFAPHLARRWVAVSGSAQALAAVAIGASVVMSADLVGRTLFLPLDLPAGIFVAAVGAPFFIGLLIRETRTS